MAPKQITISKSNFMIGLSCPTLLWCTFNAPEKLPEIDDATQAIFDQGHEVGALAKKVYSNGTEVPHGRESAKQTKELLVKRMPIFEATFFHKNAVCKVDILAPIGRDEWDLIEVKSSSHIKTEHIPDVAFQKYVLEGAGVKIRKCHLMHINNEYIKKGEINPKEFFICEDITDEVLKINSIESSVDRMLGIISGKIPSALLGVDCVSPKDCPIHSASLPEITELYCLGAKAYQLICDGITKIKDIPKDFKLNEKQCIQKEAVISGKACIKPAEIKKFLYDLKYPLHFFDFETINPAIPLFDWTCPFQHIPFQFSLHIINAPNSAPEHFEFLASHSGDPRPDLIEAIKAIKPKGTVLCYNASFEKNVLKDLLEAFPKEKWLGSVIERIEDLIIPFRNFWYYHPEQHGHASLKAVLPALTGKNYAHLAICEGGTAARKFLEMMHPKGKPISANEKAKIRKDLLAYCGQDTEAMIEIVRVLEQI